MASRILRFTGFRKQADGGAYLPPWRCLVSDRKRRHRVPRARKGPAGPMLGCRTDPCSRFGSSLAPLTLQDQLYSDPVLSRGVRRAQAVDDLHLRCAAPPRVSAWLPCLTPGGRICTDSSADRWHCGLAWNTTTGTPPYSGILTHARCGPPPRHASPCLA